MAGYLFVDLKTGLARDFNRAFEIYEHFTRGLSEGWLKGSSFSRYYDRGYSRLRIRLEFIDVEKGKEEGEKIIAELRRKNLIQGSLPWQNFSDLEPVKRATEAATRCASCLRDELKRDREVSDAFAKKPIEFAIQFEALLLNKLGFEMDFQRYGLFGNLESIVAKCARDIGPGFMGADPDFLERFLHHFRNCMNYTDQPVIFSLMYGKMLTDLAHSYKPTHHLD